MCRGDLFSDCPVLWSREGVAVDLPAVQMQEAYLLSRCCLGCPTVSDWLVGGPLESRGATGASPAQADRVTVRDLAVGIKDTQMTSVSPCCLPPALGSARDTQCFAQDCLSPHFASLTVYPGPSADARPAHLWPNSPLNLCGHSLLSAGNENFSSLL